MFGSISKQRSWLAAVLAGLYTGVCAVSNTAWAQSPAPAPAAASAAATAASSPASPSKPQSSMDAALFYQLLIGELELRGGQAGSAFEVILDAAKRKRDGQLFRRAVDIAIQGRALDKALEATKAWRSALPDSLDALRLQIQLLAANGRSSELTEPLRALIRLTPAAQQPALILALPRFMERGGEARATASMLSNVLQPYAESAETRVVARVAIARAWMNAKDFEIALALLQDAVRLDPQAAAPVALALELMSEAPAAEALVTAHLARPQTQATTTPIRLAYVRALTGAQRFAEAAQQLQVATLEQPDEPGPYLTLGILQIELRQPDAAQGSLLRFIDLVQAQVPSPTSAPSPASAPSPTSTPSPASAPPEAPSADQQAPAADALAGNDAAEDEEAAAALRPDNGLEQAWLSLAQIAAQRDDYKAAENWLSKVVDPRRALEVQTRRALMLARQGQVAQARESIQQVPEREPADARAKFLAEAGVLREVKRWEDALTVLAAANARFPDDPDLLYEQAMMAEKTDRMDQLETLLRRVMVIRPDNPHAYNALGYSLADRGLRLTEARELIVRALELSPGDPFITDSLGWVEFKLGRNAEALKLLRQAYNARPDTEIGAHLGEVLWVMGQKDEARKIWREVKARDGANEVLQETLTRLRPEL